MYKGRAFLKIASTCLVVICCSLAANAQRKATQIKCSDYRGVVRDYEISSQGVLSGSIPTVDTRFRLEFKLSPKLWAALLTKNVSFNEKARALVPEDLQDKKPGSNQAMKLFGSWSGQRVLYKMDFYVNGAPAATVSDCTPSEPTTGGVSY